MSDIEKIAAGLSKAQKRAAIEMASWVGWASAADLSIGRPATVGATLNSLVSRGLVKRRKDPSIWGRSEYQATDKCLALRAHLGNSNAE